MHVRHLAERELFAGERAANDVAYDALAGDGGVVARFERPRSASPVRLAVLSDPHVAGEERGTWKVFHRTRERVRATLADVEALGADALVVAGDLTKDGEPGNLDWMAAALADVDVPAVAVPGNHDVKEVPVSAFAERFTDDGFPVHRRVGGVDVVGLNSAARPDDGADPDLDVVSEEQLDWLAARLPGASDPIVVSHHNLPGLPAHVGCDGWAPHPPVGNADDLVARLAAHDVPLHVSGHVHLLSLTRSRGVRGLVAPSLASFPQSYLLLDVDPDGTTVRCRTAANRAGVEEAYDEARAHTPRSAVISELNAEQLRVLPIVDERGDRAPSADPIHRGEVGVRDEAVARTDDVGRGDATPDDGSP